jgi:hypothetical protein
LQILVFMKKRLETKIEENTHLLKPNSTNSTKNWEDDFKKVMPEKEIQL